MNIAKQTTANHDNLVAVVIPPAPGSNLALD